jgi:uncharacterized repeat protein (TIGR01451 family)
MGRFIDFSKRVLWRVNARIAVLIAVVGAGGVAAWQGYSHLAATSPRGPTRQIATGVDSAEAGGGVQTAVASLSDDQMPGASGSGNHRLTQYGQATEATSAGTSGAATQPPTSPYLPTNNSAGGYGASYSAGSRYGGSSSPYAQYADTAHQGSAAVPSDPIAAKPTAEASPANPYRISDATNLDPTAGAASAASVHGAHGPLPSTSGLGSYGATTAEPPATAPPATELTSTADAANPYANRYGRGAAYGQSALAASPVAVETAPPVSAGIGPPPNALPAADLSASPYAAPAPGLRSLTTSGAGSGAVGLSSSRSSASLPKGEGAGRLAAPTPGERHFEGPQQPSIVLEKVSPSEIQVGKPATFELYVRNAGQIPAQGVVITDHVPAGTQLLDVRPQPQQAADGSLVWNLGTMQPGDETQLTLQVLPQTEGEIGSTAHVSFAAAATSRSICTRPQLAIEHSAPPKVLIGEALTIGITVSNPGTGPATGVIIEEDVPAGLAHVAGSQLEYEIGTLRPGESRRLELSMRADKPGIVQNVIRVHGDAKLAAQHAVQIEIVAPQLQVAVEGPKRRFLERPATYALQVYNPGTAAARDVELAAFLPRGMKFINTDSQGQYDPSQHAVFWSLAELPPAKAGAVKLTTLPVEPGEQRLRVEGRGALGLSAVNEQLVQVEQAAELLHTVKDVDEVIEVGSETSYEIRVTNTGTKAATNVRIAALMPAGMAAVNGEGPTRAGGDATQIIFEPLARLNPQEEVLYKVQVQGKQPGDHIVRVQLSSDEWPTPVTREESTRVYQDR